MAELQLSIRTPHKLVFDEPVAGLRVPTITGLVGLRPRGEPLVLALEVGLIVVHAHAGLRFVASTGGLIESGRERCCVYTPFAAIGESEQEMLDALDRTLETPSIELIARRRLAELEQRILGELHEDRRRVVRRSNV